METKKIDKFKTQGTHSWVSKSDDGDEYWFDRFNAEKNSNRFFIWKNDEIIGTVSMEEVANMVAEKNALRNEVAE